MIWASASAAGGGHSDAVVAAGAPVSWASARWRCGALWPARPHLPGRGRDGARSFTASGCGGAERRHRACRHGRGAAGRVQQEHAEAERVLRELARAGMERADTVCRARRRRGRRPRRLLRGGVPAWSRGRAGSDDGGRAGRLRVRRQDRRRPSRGEELRRSLSSAGRRLHRPGAARRRCRPRSFARASPRS